MSYELAMEKAGATVHAFESFGSYSGDWWARVTYKGRTGWVNGSFGSCSGCDAFEAEFGWADDEKPGYGERLANFGAEYLDQFMTDEEAIASASRNLEWDMDADAMVKFIREHAGSVSDSIPQEDRSRE